MTPSTKVVSLSLLRVSDYDMVSVAGTHTYLTCNATTKESDAVRVSFIKCDNGNHAVQDEDIVSDGPTRG